MEKDIQVIGVLNMSGTSSKTNRPYSMFKLFAMEPIVIRGNVTNAIGYQTREFDCDEQVLKTLENPGIKFPCKCTAFIELTRDNKALVNHVRVLHEKDIAPLQSASTDKKAS